jgi:thiol-disulfide isomerase/thioredoxin
MSRLSLTLLCILGLAVAACDTGGQSEAQESTATAAGEVDRSMAGEPLPAVNLSDPRGRVLDMGALRGTPVLLNLWATWCAPCVKEMPQLDELAARYPDRLVVVAASQDVQGAKAVEPFFRRSGLTNLDPWLDSQNRLMEGLGADALPVTILYDVNGQEVWRMTGPFDWASEEAFALVEEGFAELPGSGKVER